MYNLLLATIILAVSNIYANNEIGCASLSRDKECSENSLLDENITLLDNLYDSYPKEQNSQKRVRISQDIDTLLVTYQNKKFLIERRVDSKNKECPPECIQPMYIANIKTVAELEVLKFISLLQNSKDRLLIDARATKEYKKSTIPTAFNIPYSMLYKNSKYKDEILKLLGGKKLQKKWFFKRVHKLLIFDNGPLDNQATKIINSLIEVGYPQNKILYYRGGLRSWKSLGLSTI